MSKQRPDRSEKVVHRRIGQYVAGLAIALLIGGALAASSGQPEIALGFVFCGCFAGAAAVWLATRKPS